MEAKLQDKAFNENKQRTICNKLNKNNTDKKQSTRI